jgi:cytochrome oxidase Cu insertion factor (SCO1/SenC/PrrC family)
VPGMSAGLKTNNSTIVAAFHAALLHQGLIVLFIIAVAGVTLNLLRSLHLRQLARHPDGRPGVAAVSRPTESPARRVLRISFGLIWLFDGVLQGQASMPLGLVPQGIRPAASASPAWVQHVVQVGTTAWSYHPVQAAAASVWIQIGIGLWLLVVPRGRWSQAGGLVSLGWALVVWVFGEAFGGVFAPGLTWLFGAPGAVVFYGVAGALIALPESIWATPRPGRIVLRAMGAFFVGMAVLQAWPGRGFWSGGVGGTLTAMVRGMAQTSQPRILGSWVASFASFDARHGWAVNLFAVTALALVGAALLSAWPRLVRAGVVVAVVLCLADWVLVEDFGFFGGVGTDPNSMIPLALVCVAGYLALVRPTGLATPGVVPLASASDAGTRRARLLTNPGYAFRCVAALAALAIVLVGGVPMAVATASPNADPILATAVDGAPDTLHTPAPAFSLIDQHGHRISLAGLRGKTIALTFLDPVCTSDCPIIAQEFRQADQMLGPDASRVDLVAIDANPRYISTDDLTAFDAQESLDHVPNWLYLTGSVRQLRRSWGEYGILVGYASGGAMIAHSDTAYVINRTGGLRYVLNADPGSTTSATRSSFAVTLANAITRTINGT